jgi:hypothetical protein
MLFAVCCNIVFKYGFTGAATSKAYYLTLHHTALETILYGFYYGSTYDIDQYQTTSYKQYSE